VKIQFHCEIYSEANELLTTAEFLLVFVDIASGKPCVPSDEIKNILEHLSV
jgi:acyl-CoA thioester hydrolase